MWRTALLVLGWILASLALYAALLGLELHWNFFDWSPRFDFAAGGLLLGVLLALTVIWFIAQTAQPTALRLLSLVLVSALVGLAIYVVPAEPKSEGLFGRQLPSPFWYRAGRLLFLCCPSAFWFWAFFRSRRDASEPLKPEESATVRPAESEHPGDD